MNLSNQAKWYFNGNFPVYVKPAVGYKRVEPTAMQELVTAGLVLLRKDKLFGDAWFLTDTGVSEKSKKLSALVY